MTNLQTLFEEWQPDSESGDLRHEMEAVQTGRKAMSVFIFERKNTGDGYYSEVMQLALDLGLFVVQRAEIVDSKGDLPDQLYIFVSSINETWRIPTYIAMRRILREYAWSDGAEYLQSFLLGYTDEEISLWMKEQKRTRLSWTGLTVYLMMTHKQRESICRLGARCLDPDSLTEEVVVFFNRNQSALRENVLDLIPKGMTISRVSIKQSFLFEMFGSPKNWSQCSTIASKINKEVAVSLNPALDSNFQFLDSDGWH